MKRQDVLRIKHNDPHVWVINATWRRLIVRKYPRHFYIIAFGRIVIDWWPNDDRDRLQLFSRTVKFIDRPARQARQTGGEN